MIDFKDFAPFIQEYIYSEGWQHLRQIQLDAAEAIFHTNEDILIASPTASGKTEAALFPIITEMYNNPGNGVTTLYVSPLKALINDQFLRLNDVLFNANIQVFRWHGDVNSYQKEKALNTNNIILQITPESIESLFINHTADLIKLFSNLKYIIIDEVHYFVESSRGIQLISLIERIERLIKRHIRRIGLSATIGNLELAANYISSGHKTKILTIRQDSTKNRLLVLYNVEKEDEKDKYYQDIYRLINGRKCIVFANSKKLVEQTAYHLKKINKDFGGNNYILVHHGNISKTLRDEVEQKMKKESNPITAVATMTLELGIDLGTLERVVQIGSPNSISSFVQRLGRTGRRDGVKEMCFTFNKDFNDVEEVIPWDFLFATAMISLYIKEKYIEDLVVDKYPYSVLVQQTLSHIATSPGIRTNMLASNILNTTVFKNISSDDYKLLLNYMIKCNLIENNNQELYLAELGERLVNNYDFYAVFYTEKDYEVVSNNKVIGSIQKKLPIGSIFNLAGSTWEVVNINQKTKSLTVKEVKGYKDLTWEGSGLSHVDQHLMQHLKYILKNKQDFKFLSEHAKEVYNKAFEAYNSLYFINDYIVQTNPDEYYIFKYLGTKEFITLYYLLRQEFIYVKPIFDEFIPLAISVKTNNIESVIDYIENKIQTLNEEDIRFDLQFHKKGKYDEYIPEQLLKKAFLKNNLNIKNLK